MTEINDEEEFSKKFPIYSIWRERGKVHISIMEDKRARFFIKCYNLKLTPRKLFNMVIDKFLSDDPEFISIISKESKKRGYHNRTYIAKKTKDDEVEKEYKENFEIDELFIQELYDFFEEGEE